MVYKFILLIYAVFIICDAKCWTFNSMHATNGKIIDILDAEEGFAPIPYEKNDIEQPIDEENPPEPPSERIILIVPGTKWCGPGNIAANYFDIGNMSETDTCCRNHDYCGDIIPAGHTAHGLVNDDFYTKLNCECDDKFLTCLHGAKDGLGPLVGKVYFNAIGTRCFKNEHPIVKCTKKRGFIIKKCLEYELDYTKPKIYQWFDVPQYV